MTSIQTGLYRAGSSRKGVRVVWLAQNAAAKACSILSVYSSLRVAESCSSVDEVCAIHVGRLYDAGSIPVHSVASVCVLASLALSAAVGPRELPRCLKKRAANGLFWQAWLQPADCSGGHGGRSAFLCGAIGSGPSPTAIPDFTW